MNTRPAPVSTTPVLRSRPRLDRAIGAVLVLIAITLARPWGDGPASPHARGGEVPGSSPAAGAVTVTGAPAPVSASRPERSPGPGEIACSAPAWEIVSIDRLGDWTARAWTPATPLLAPGPLDPSIGEVRLSSSALLAVGACAPATGSDGRAQVPVPAAVIAAWRLDGPDARAIDLELVGRPDPAAGIAPLYRPAGPPGAHRAWPSGRFVLELAPVAGSGTGDAAHRGPDRPAGWFIGLAVGAPP